MTLPEARLTLEDARSILNDAGLLRHTTWSFRWFNKENTIMWSIRWHGNRREQYYVTRKQKNECTAIFTDPDSLRKAVGL